MKRKLTPDEFGKQLLQNLSPSKPIQSPEFLRGRANQLSEIRKALYSPGRQVFIYGYRGVGKSSLAQTAAFQHQSSDKQPILLACGRDGSFYQTICDLASKVLPSDPRLVKQTLAEEASAKNSFLSVVLRNQLEFGRIQPPTSLNEAVDMVGFVSSLHSVAPVVVIDEFDLLDKPQEHALFADFVKQVADQSINLKIIFCGIGESLDDLFKAHESAYRYFHTVKLERLDWEPRMEIVSTAANSLGIALDETTNIRIARISDGFPHYVHLIAEKLFWEVFEHSAHESISADLFERALHNAVEAIGPQLKGPYELATKKYQNDCEEILWSLADDHELVRQIKDIYSSYQRIMKGRNGKRELKREQFYSRINNLTKDQWGEILIGNKKGWYEFREKMIRGYARLRAEQAKVELEIEHPLQKRRISIGNTGG